MSTSPDNEETNPLVCFCFGVTQAEIIAVIQQHNPQSVIEITDHCKAGNGCTSCWPLLEQLLLQYPPQAP